MSLTSKEAAETLSDVERAAKRSTEAYCYEKAAPHLFQWGAIWFVGYVGTEILQENANWLWLPLIVAGCLGSFLINRRYAFAPPANAGEAASQEYRRHALRRSWQSFAAMGIVAIFVFATYALMWPVHGLQFAVFPPLVVGAIYAATGIWRGVRYLVTGILLSALTLIGFFYLREHFLLWMAVIGGGALILAGLWFRKA